MLPFQEAFICVGNEPQLFGDNKKLATGFISFALFLSDFVEYQKQAQHKKLWST